MTGLQPWLSPWADWLVANAREEVQVTSTFRSYAQQLSLYLTQWASPYPAAPPGRSYHEYGRAFDLKASDGELYRLGSIWQSVGGTWHPSDPIHFQA